MSNSFCDKPHFFMFRIVFWIFHIKNAQIFTMEPVLCNMAKKSVLALVKDTKKPDVLEKSLTECQLHR